MDTGYALGRYLEASRPAPPATETVMDTFLLLMILLLVGLTGNDERKSREEGRRTVSDLKEFNQKLDDGLRVGIDKQVTRLEQRLIRLEAALKAHGIDPDNPADPES
jgi:hypothetical protein